MNKIKEELRQKLSELDVDNAYSVVKKSVLSFSNFLRENYHSDTEVWSFNKLPLGFYQDRESYDILSVEEVFKIWENETNTAQ